MWFTHVTISRSLEVATNTYVYWIHSRVYSNRININMNYTEEITKQLIADYQAAEDKQAIVPVLAEKYGKPVKSIIGKLSKEGVYEKKQYLTKQGTRPVTKKEMIHDLSKYLEIDPEKIQGLEKTPKLELEYLVDIVRKRLFSE